MRTWKCPNCKRETIEKSKIVIVLCKCGEYMDEQIIKLGDEE